MLLLLADGTLNIEKKEFVYVVSMIWLSDFSELLTTEIVSSSYNP